MGRCFYTGSNPDCYKVSCDSSNTISIDVDGESITCAPGDTNHSTGQGVLTCPTNNADFCSIKECENWCYTQGLCLNGECILLDNCTLAISGCSTCVQDTLNRCTSCASPLFPSSDRLSCVDCQVAVTSCSSCIVDSEYTRCTSCSSPLYPAADRKSCVDCQVAITDCTTCTVADQVTKCTACGAGKAPSGDSLSCIMSTCAISGCIGCVDNNGN